MRFAWLLLLPLVALAEITVPFVGCPADGQTGPIAAPKGDAVDVNLPAREASQLAYYSALGLGVLAPRGWVCFGIYGSSGAKLQLTRGSTGGDSLAEPMIQISRTFSDGSGSTTVAEKVAQLFPAHRAWALKELEAKKLPTPAPLGNLTHRSNTFVDYRTPGPHYKAAILDPATYDLVEVSVLLTPELEQLVLEIVAQIERDAAKLR